jgi:hypothetical protein
MSFEQALMLSIAAPMAASVVLVHRAWFLDRWLPYVQLHKRRPAVWRSLTGGPTQPGQAVLASLVALHRSSPVSQYLADLRTGGLDAEFNPLFARAAAAWGKAMMAFIVLVAWSLLVFVVLLIRSTA